MKIRMSIITAFAFIILFGLSAQGQVVNDTADQTSIFPKGTRAPAGSFTGVVWLQPLHTDDSLFHCVMSNVTFEPGARTFWHKHPAGQILLITSGICYYQERGKSIQVFHKGDVVKSLPGVENWHGASPDSMMAHIAVNPNAEKGVVTWLQPVTDDEYKGIKK